MTTELYIDRVLHDGRGVRRHWNTEETDSVAGWPEVAYDAVRGLNHLTLTSEPIPAPVLYDIIGNLGGMVYMLPQLFDQLAKGLERSLSDLNVYEASPAGDPAATAATAQEQLVHARWLAHDLAAAMSKVQTAIAGQGYRAEGEGS